MPPAAVAETSGRLLLSALAILEDALVARVSENGMASDDLNKQFVRYSKIKALALHPQTGTMEQRAALRTALVEAIRMVV